MSRSGTRWRKHVATHKGRHDRCSVDVAQGFVFDFDARFSKGCIPLADFIRQREEEIRNARARRNLRCFRWVTVCRVAPFPPILPPRGMFDPEPEGIRWYTRL